MSASPTPRRGVSGVSSGERAAICVLTALALALRVTSLSRSLFTDEAYSLALAQRAFAHMFVLFAYESNGTLYSIVLWPLIRIFGTGETLLRFPAVIAGTASIPAMWWAARQFSDRCVPLLAAALLAINPMAVWYSQEARAYAFVVLASCIAFGALARALGRAEGDRAAGHQARIGYVVAMVGLAYCELLAVVIVLPAQALIAWRRGREGVEWWLRSLLALAVCCMPLLAISAISRSRRNPLYWLPKANRELAESALQEFTGGFSGVTAVRWVTVLALAALIAVAVWRVRRPDSADRRDRRATLAIAASWGLVPGALLFVVSSVEPIFWPRYAIVALPGLCLLAALCADELWRARRGVAIAAALLASIALASTVADERQVNALQENWPPIASWLRAERSAGEPTIVDNALVLPSLGYYDRAFRARDDQLIVQEWHDQSLPFGFVGYKDRMGYGSFPDGPPTVAKFVRLVAHDGGSAWMIVSEVDDALQADPRTGVAEAWARSHCKVQVRESVGVWALHAKDCHLAAGER
jgi:mannosyltransferase